MMNYKIGSWPVAANEDDDPEEVQKRSQECRETKKDYIDAITLFKNNHPKNGYFNIFCSRALTNHTALENILLASEYIFQVVKDEGGGTVLFLGRTPCLVQLAYEEVLKIEKDNTQVPVHLNFSGHPDALTKREGDFYRSSTNIARNIVTPEKLTHYFGYLDAKGILSTKKIFLVDILGSGGSLNSFLRLINAYYRDRQTQKPELTFLNLTQDVFWSRNKPEHYTFTKTGNVSNRGTLTLPADSNKNMQYFQIIACGIPMFHNVQLDILDNDMFQEFIVHGIQYPAQKWTPEFDKQRDEGGKYHQAFYQHLKNKFSTLISAHQKMKL